MLKNPRLVFLDDCMGCTAYSAIEAGRSLTERDFKKWYNHIFREIVRNGAIQCVTVLACYDDEDGDECDISSYWGNEEMKYDPNISFC